MAGGDSARLPILSFGVLMRSFLLFFAYCSLIMAGVSVGCGLAGLIGAVETLVFVMAFVGLHALILWEMEYTTD